MPRKLSKIVKRRPEDATGESARKKSRKRRRVEGRDGSKVAGRPQTAAEAKAEGPQLPADLRPSRRVMLRGASLWWPALPTLAILGLSFLPRIAAHRALATEVRGAAALLAIWQVVLLARLQGEPQLLEVVVRRPHYLQLITQSGVYLYWGYYFAPVASYVPLLLVQLAFVYGFDALLSWTRGRPWVVGFAHVPIVWSTNLFLWFKDDVFALQLAMVALGVLGKELVRWRRNGVQRHVFNPSSLALAVASIGLIATGTAGKLTHASAIALSQDNPPYIHQVLFLLGLIVQLNFPVVLVTMSAATTVVLLGAAYTAATGVFIFGTTSIPAAVLLGSLLLVTDPATSPESRTGKVLFGASYGALVFAAFPLLELIGPLGHFDKLLPVPLLNLLVPAFDRVAKPIGERLERGWQSVRGPALAWMTAPRAGNYLHVAVWAGVFALMWSTRAVGKDHEGRSIAFWHEACAAKRPGACVRLYRLVDLACDSGEAAACEDLGADIAEGKVHGSKSARDYFAKACDAGLASSCARLSAIDRGRRAEPADLLSGLRAACDAGEGTSCHNLGDAFNRGAGVERDAELARAFYQRACDLGVARGCSSVAALEMGGGGAGVDKSRAAKAFRQACDAGDPTGCANLGIMHMLGDGVPRDPARAAELLGRACDAGVTAACARLAELKRTK